MERNIYLPSHWNQIGYKTPYTWASIGLGKTPDHTNMLIENIQQWTPSIFSKCRREYPRIVWNMVRLVLLASSSGHPSLGMKKHGLN